MAFVLADVTMGKVMSEIGSFILQFTVAILLVTGLVAYFIALHMKKTAVEPINAIADAAERYVRDKNAGLPSVDHFAALNIKTGDEIENLSLVMSDMEHELSEYEKELTDEVAKRERISTELSMASGIQAHFLPSYKGEMVSLIKATAVVGYIAVQDLTKMGDIVRGRTYEAFFPLIAVAVIYFILAGILTALVSRIELWTDPKRRSKESILEGVNTHD